MFEVQGVKELAVMCRSSACFSIGGKYESMTGIIKSMEKPPLKRDESKWDCSKAE